MKLDKWALIIGLLCWFVVTLLISVFIATDVVGRPAPVAALRIFGWTLASGALLFGVFAQATVGWAKREEP